MGAEEFAGARDIDFLETDPGLRDFHNMPARSIWVARVAGGRYRPASLRERWRAGASFSCGTKKTAIPIDDRMARLFCEYLEVEGRYFVALGRKWSPRIKICQGPNCSRFIYDGSEKRVAKTCSTRCRVAKWRRDG